MTVVFAHLPLGLGLRRCGAGADESGLVFGDVHLLDPDGIDELVASIADATGPVLVWSAGHIPDRLIDVVDETVAASPCVPEDFASQRISADDAVVDSAFGLSGGWPEAVTVHGDEVRPSLALLRFVRGLAARRPSLHQLAELVCCDEQPVPLEVLSEAMGVEAERFEDLLGELETYGLVALRGGGIELAVPIAAEHLLPTAVARRQARVRLAGAWRNSDPVWAAAIAAECGQAVPDSTRAELVRALREAEASRDYKAWERLSRALARFPESEERVVGLLSAARLSLLRGRRSEALAMLGTARPYDRCLAELEATSHAAALFGLESGNMLLSWGPVQLSSVLPSASAGFHYGLDLSPEGTAHVYSESDGPSLGPIQHALSVSVEAIVNDYSILSQLTRDRSFVMNLFGLVLDVFLRCAEGKFADARELLTAATGERFDRIEGRLLQLAALAIACGTDVGQTRELLLIVPTIPKGALGAPWAAAVRAHSELVVGHAPEAWNLVSYAWDVVLDRGLVGLERGLIGDALTIAYWSGNLDRLRPPASEDLAALVAAVADGDPHRAEAAVEAADKSPYLQARLMCLAADRHQRCGDDEAARSLLQRAATTFSALGAPVDLARAIAQSRRGGASPVDQMHPVVEQVVDSKQRVLGLVGAGLTNAEIAAELHLSPGTVKRRISELLVEYSVTNRRQLGELARASGSRGRAQG